MAKNFVEALKHFADYRDISAPSINHATVDVTEKYARRRLKLKKKRSAGVSRPVADLPWLAVISSFA